MKRVTKYHIRNFQSIRELELDIDGDGLYWIRGKNNIGKSNLLGAMSTVFTNVPNNQYAAYIRDNCNTFKIKVWFDDDWVELSRGGSDYYEWCIDGVTNRVDKTMGKVPPELVEYFNLYYEAEKTKRYLNITSSDDALLFVSTTGGDNDRLLQIALGTEVVMGASKKAEQLKRQSVAEQKTIRNLREEYEGNLGQLQTQYDNVNDKLAQLSHLEEILDAEYVITSTLKEQRDLVTDYAILGTKLYELVSDERAYKEADLDQHFNGINDIKRHLLNEQDYLTQVTMDESIKVLDKDELQVLTSDFGLLSRIQEQVDQEGVYLQLVAALEMLDDQIADIESAKQNHTGLDMLTQHIREVKRYQELHLEQDKINQQIDELTAEYEQVRVELGECPLCGSSLTGHSH